MIDVETLTDEELRGLASRIGEVLDRRGALEDARTAVNDAVAAYAGVAGVSVAEAWGVLSPPPVDAPPAPEPVDAPEWVQPVGAHDAYPVGARVTYRGAVYESVLAGNAFSPAAYPQGWRKL